MEGVQEIKEQSKLGKRQRDGESLGIDPVDYSLAL
jgi:hypothetical protein